MLKLRLEIGIALVCVLGWGCGDEEAGDPANPHTDPDDGPDAGNPDGTGEIPAEAQAVDTSNPDHVVGDGTPDSCTGRAFVDTVALGGIITFDCGPDPVVITVGETARIFNRTGPEIVIDGGGTVTLSGAGARRILYMNTCDQSLEWLSDHCQNQDEPHLTVQNLTFVDGNATGEVVEGGGGGAIFVRGGRFKAVNCRFFNNICDDVGTDVGGGAIRVLSQYENRPVYIVNSTFGGDDESLGNVCANGGALSSIGVSWTVIDSFFQNNRAIGLGANEGSPGGGNGGAIYNDGDTFTLTVQATQMLDNTANEGGGAIFYVSNNRTGTLIIQDSTLRNNPSLGFETQGYPGIFVLANGDPQVSNSTIE